MTQMTDRNELLETLWEVEPGDTVELHIDGKDTCDNEYEVLTGRVYRTERFDYESKGEGVTLRVSTDEIPDKFHAVSVDTEFGIDAEGVTRNKRLKVALRGMDKHGNTNRRGLGEPESVEVVD